MVPSISRSLKWWKPKTLEEKKMFEAAKDDVKIALTVCKEGVEIGKCMGIITESTGCKIPYRKMGFDNFQHFLFHIDDILEVRFLPYVDRKFLFLRDSALSEDARHLRQMVQEQSNTKTTRRYPRPTIRNTKPIYSDVLLESAPPPVFRSQPSAVSVSFKHPGRYTPMYGGRNTGYSSGKGVPRYSGGSYKPDPAMGYSRPVLPSIAKPTIVRNFSSAGYNSVSINDVPNTFRSAINDVPNTFRSAAMPVPAKPLKPVEIRVGGQTTYPGGSISNATTTANKNGVDEVDKVKRNFTFSDSNPLKDRRFCFDDETEDEDSDELEMVFSGPPSHTLNKPTLVTRALQEPATENQELPKPALQRPTIQIPELQNLTLDKPALQKPTWENSELQKPTSQIPALQNPASQIPALQKPTSQIHALQKPTSQIHALQKPTSQMPGLENPLLVSAAFEEPELEKQVVCNSTLKKPVLEKLTLEKSGRDENIDFCFSSPFYRELENFLEKNSEIMKAYKVKGFENISSLDVEVQFDKQKEYPLGNGEPLNWSDDEWHNPAISIPSLQVPLMKMCVFRLTQFLDMFSFQLAAVGNTKKEDDLTSQMTTWYNAMSERLDEIKLDSLRRDGLYAGYDRKTGKWCRVQVDLSNGVKNDLVDVIKIDDGIKIQINRTNLRYLKPRFAKLPGQGFNADLYFVPGEPFMSASATANFNEFMMNNVGNLFRVFVCAQLSDTFTGISKLRTRLLVLVEKSPHLDQRIL